MSILIVVELTCNRCERTGEHRMNRINIVTAEQFVHRRLAGWNVDPRGFAYCPECVEESGQRARRTVEMSTTADGGKA
jgi:hypothetical protein